MKVNSIWRSTLFEGQHYLEGTTIWRSHYLKVTTLLWRSPLSFGKLHFRVLTDITIWCPGMRVGGYKMVHFLWKKKCYLMPRHKHFNITIYFNFAQVTFPWPYDPTVPPRTYISVRPPLFQPAPVSMATSRRHSRYNAPYLATHSSLSRRVCTQRKCFRAAGSGCYVTMHNEMCEMRSDIDHNFTFINQNGFHIGP